MVAQNCCWTWIPISIEPLCTVKQARWVGGGGCWTQFEMALKLLTILTPLQSYSSNSFPIFFFLFWKRGFLLCSRAFTSDIQVIPTSGLQCLPPRTVLELWPRFHHSLATHEGRWKFCYMTEFHPVHLLDCYWISHCSRLCHICPVASSSPWEIIFAPVQHSSPDGCHVVVTSLVCLLDSLCRRHVCWLVCKYLTRHVSQVAVLPSSVGCPISAVPWLALRLNRKANIKPSITSMEETRCKPGCNQETKYHPHAVALFLWRNVNLIVEDAV